MKKTFIRGLSLCLLIALSACGGQSPSEPPTQSSVTTDVADPVVARINDVEFTQSQLERELTINRAIYRLTNGRDLILQDLEGTLINLIPSLLLDQHAQHAEISASEADIDAALEKYVAGRNATVVDLEGELIKQNVTLADFRTKLARNVRIETYLAQVFEDDSDDQIDFRAWLRDLQENAAIEILYEPPDELPMLGSIAPDFTLNDLEGEPVTLSQLRGQPVMINFWATWCIPCRAEMPAFQRAYEAHKDAGLVILAVNVEEGPELVRPFVTELELTFDILYDSQAEVTKTYLVTGLPRTLFVDRQGVIKHIQVGEVPENLLDSLLAQLRRRP